MKEYIKSRNKEFDENWLNRTACSLVIPAHGIICFDADEIKSFQTQTIIGLLEKISDEVENMIDIGALALGSQQAMEHNRGWENCKYHVIRLLQSKVVVNKPNESTPQ